MSEIKISDLVDPRAIEEIKTLDIELKAVLTTYVGVARDLAQGINMPVKVSGDIDKLETLLATKSREAAEANSRLTDTLNRQSQAIANTTNTISRHLAEQERVNKTQRESYTEHERVKKLLDQYHDTYEGQTKRLVQLNAQLEANKKAQKDNEKALSMGRMNMVQYQSAQAELIAQHRALTQEKRTLTQLMTAEEKAAQSQEGSYAHMSQQLELLKKAYKDLSSEGREADFGKELEGAIQNLDAHLKDMAADMGEFQRNVGNYAIANKDLKQRYDELVGTLAALQSSYNQLSDAEKSSDEGRLLAERITEVSDAARETKHTLDEQTKAVEEARQSLGDSSDTTASVKKDLKELVLEIANLTLEYQNLTEEEKASADGQALADHIHDLIERAGALKDAISDTNTAITNAASDTRGFDQLGGALQLAIDGFGLATGAAEMLGISSDDLAEVQTKLQAAIAASNAMQSIQNTLQSESALMQGVNLAQTKLRTVAENLHTAAQGKGVIATTALTAAQWAFNAAANANPIGLICVVIIGCIAAVYGLIKAFTAFFGVSDDAIEKYRQQKQALDDLCEANDRLIERMKARGATEAELLQQSLLNKEAEKKAADALFARASKLYDEDEDEYKEALEAKKKADEEFETHKEDSLNYLLGVIHASEEEEKKQRLGTYEYKRQLIKAELEQQKAIAATLLAQEKITRRVYENLVASLDKAAKTKIAAVDSEEKKSKTRSSGTDDAKKKAEELRKAVRAGEDAMLKLITDSHERQRQTEILSYRRQLKDLQAQLAKTKTTEVEARTALERQIQGLVAEHNRKMQELEMAGLERRNKAEADFIASRLDIVESGTQEELDWKLKALDNQEQAELLAVTKSEQSKLLTAEQAEEMRVNIAIKYANLREDAEEEHASKMCELIERQYAGEQNAQSNAYTSAVTALKMRYAQELAAAKGNLSKQEAIKARFEEDQARLSEQYAQQTVQSTIDMIEEVLKNEKLADEERLKYEQELANAKIDLNNLVAEANSRSVEKQIADDNKLREKRKANLQNWIQVASDSLGAINELVSAVYDAKIAKVEEEQESNTAAGEAEQERITQLVENKVITEEEGEARKRAAAAQTAKKNEELEKKKAALQHKQAVFQKATDLAQAGISTALAITNALTMQPFPLGVAMAAIAGAMGAIQIATILATPIPKYAKGTEYHSGGPAIVGDGGKPEIVLYRGNAWVTPDSPTLVDIPAGAAVIPDAYAYAGISDSVGPFGGGPEPNPIIVNNDYSRLERSMKEVSMLIRLQIKAQRKFYGRAEYNNYMNQNI